MYHDDSWEIASASLLIGIGIGIVIHPFVMIFIEWMATTLIAIFPIIGLVVLVGLAGYGLVSLYRR